MTIKEAALQSLVDLKKAANYMEVYKHMVNKKYYIFEEAKTPWSTVSALLGNFIRHGDTRVKRIPRKGSTFVYYAAKYETEIDLGKSGEVTTEKDSKNNIKTYNERDLHPLLSSYLKNEHIYAKTIFHEKSKRSKDKNQVWIHPDMVGIKFQNLKNEVTQKLLKLVNKEETFKIYSYEIKKEISTDNELKEAYFQAVSNSSWANYGYLVAYEFADNLLDELERLNRSFGIGAIEINANPFESKVLYPARLNEIDFKTMDKLAKVNKTFEDFLGQLSKLLNASEDYIGSSEKELNDFCDDFLESDLAIEQYCIKHHIPVEKQNDENNEEPH